MINRFSRANRLVGLLLDGLLGVISMMRGYGRQKSIHTVPIAGRDDAEGVDGDAGEVRKGGCFEIILKPSNDGLRQ